MWVFSDVQDLSDTSTIPADVKDKILRFAKAALAAAWMKGKSYLSVGAVSMGIAGSIVNPDFFQDYLGMRTEFVDMSEIVRRLEEKIYSDAEFKAALAWVKDNCKEGPDINAPEVQHSRDRKDKAWATCSPAPPITSPTCAPTGPSARTSSPWPASSLQEATL